MQSSEATPIMRSRLSSPLSPEFDPMAVAENLLRSELARRRRQLWRRYEKSPSGFAREIVGANPTSYQAEILETLFSKRRIAVRSPHGAGKTAIAAWATLFGIATFGDDFKIVTTAGTWRQLTKFLWPEITKWYRRTKWAELGTRPELLMLSMKAEGGEAFAVASDNPDLIEGAHASKLLYILDECKAIPERIWDSVEGAFATGTCFALAISTPGSRSGRFYDIFRRMAGFEDWQVRHVTLVEAIEMGRISKQWAEERKRQWGESSPVYQAKVLGEFPEQSEDSLISLAWIEAARERELEPEGKKIGGLDVARFGDDDSCLVIRQGECVLEVRGWHGNDTMETAGRAKVSGVEVCVDAIGVGAGVVDRLKEQKYPAHAINVGEKAVDGERFKNLKTELFWNLRERFYNGDIDLSRIDQTSYDRLCGELTELKYKPMSDGTVMLESKEDLKKRLGRSPDYADALALAFAGQTTAVGVTVRTKEVIRRGVL